MKTKERIPLHDHSGFNSGGLVAASTVVTSMSLPTAPTTGGGGASAAVDVSVSDVADHFAGSNVETVLAEIAADISALALDDLADVNAPTPADGDALTWNAGASEWVPVHALTESDVIGIVTPDTSGCDSLTVVGGQGVIAFGTHADLHEAGGTTIQINEESGTPGFEIEAAFSGIDGITGMYLKAYYTAAHTVVVQLYNYTAVDWDTVFTLATNQTGWAVMWASIAGGDDYSDGSGNARVRFYHAAAGNPTHRLYLDYLTLVHSGVVAGGGDVTGQLGAVFDGGLSILVAPKYQDVVAPYSGTLTGWVVYAQQVGSVTFGVSVATPAAFPTFTDIVGAAAPALSSDDAAASAAMTGWTLAVTAGDIFRFTLSSVSAIRQAVVVLNYSRP